MIRCGADVVIFAEDTIACIAKAKCRVSAGVEDRACQQGSPRNFGDLAISIHSQPPRRCYQNCLGPGHPSIPGSERGKAWYRRTTEMKQDGKGGEGAESADSTVEARESVRRDPAEGRGRHERSGSTSTVARPDSPQVHHLDSDFNT